MRKGTLARIEVFGGLLLVALLLALAGYGVVAMLADRIDPRVRDCVAREEKNAALTGRPLGHENAVRLCKHLQSIGALQ